MASKANVINGSAAEPNPTVVNGAVQQVPTSMEKLLAEAQAKLEAQRATQLKAVPVPSELRLATPTEQQEIADFVVAGIAAHRFAKDKANPGKMIDLRGINPVWKLYKDMRQVWPHLDPKIEIERIAKENIAPISLFKSGFWLMMTADVTTGYRSAGNGAAKQSKSLTATLQKMAELRAARGK